MKAGRRWCLRCDKELHPPVSQHFKLPAWLESRGGGTLIFATVGALVLCFAVVAWWGSMNAVDDVARPAPGASTTPPAPKAAAQTAEAAAPSYTPVSAFDSTQSGSVAFGNGDVAGARAKFEQALEKNADDPEALNDLGLTLERSGQLDDAIARFSRAAELAPAKWSYRFNLGHALARQQKWDAAIGEYRKALGLFPTDYATQFNLAMALHGKGDDRGAVPEYEKAIQLAPSEASFHVALAASLERIGRLSDAQREFRRYLEMEPAGAEAPKVKAHLDELAAASRPAQGGPSS
jgi:Flp pilus assembly protein TadD